MNNGVSDCTIYINIDYCDFIKKLERTFYDKKVILFKEGN